jgi:hypothetical protein
MTTSATSNAIAQKKLKRNIYITLKHYFLIQRVEFKFNFYQDFRLTSFFKIISLVRVAGDSG